MVDEDEPPEPLVAAGVEVDEEPEPPALLVLVDEALLELLLVLVDEVLTVVGTAVLKLATPAIRLTPQKLAI